MTPAAELKAVRAQYEELPYPPRDPEAERTRLINTLGDALDVVNYYCFGGTQDYKGFRALVAGGGTGDGLVFLAEQLRGSGAEIIYLDFSEASLDVAKARCRVRGLDAGVTFIRESLLNLPKLGLGAFDFINCTGVLHHLEDPDAGLRALSDVLKDNGALYVMVYAKYGRAGIYPLQDALKLVAGPELPTSERVRATRAIVKSLPAAHLFKLAEQRNMEELREHGDAGLFDLLLHAQDRCYTVPEIYAWLKRTGLQLVQFQAYGGSGSVAYDPLTLVKDPVLRARIEQLPRPAQHALAELLHGSMGKHSFYAMKQPVSPPSPYDLDMVPYICRQRFDADLCPAIAAQIEREPQSAVEIYNPESDSRLSFRPTAHAAAIFRALDGKRSLREIFAHVREQPGHKDVGDEALSVEFVSMFDRLNVLEWMLLRAKEAVVMPSGLELQRRMVKITQ